MYGIERETTGTFMFSKFLILLVSNPSPLIRETCLWINRYSMGEEANQVPIYHPLGAGPFRGHNNLGQCWQVYDETQIH